MKLLNVGCGGHRPQEEAWWNLDELRKHLKPGTPERTNLDAEPRYVDHSLSVEAMPFEPQAFDGILCQHVLEHFCCHDAVLVLHDCYRLLKPYGIILASVPEAEYFYLNYLQDTRANAVEIFGEPISPDEPWQESFFDYALFHKEHKQILTSASLGCLFLKAGFRTNAIFQMPPFNAENFHVETKSDPTVLQMLMAQRNRMKFSATVLAMRLPL